MHRLTQVDVGEKEERDQKRDKDRKEKEEIWDIYRGNRKKRSEREASAKPLEHPSCLSGSAIVVIYS